MKALKNQLYFFIFLLISNVVVAQDNINTESAPTDTLLTEPSTLVVFEGDTLFALTESLGPFSPDERASAITLRLEELASTTLVVHEDSFNITDEGGTSLINYSDTPLMSIIDKDVDNTAFTRQQLAIEYKEIISATFVKNVQIKSAKSWAIKIGLTLLTLAGLILIFYLLGKLFKWINSKIIEYDKKLKRKRKSILRYIMPRGPQNVFILISNIAKYVIILLILILYLPLMFSFLPWTKGIVSEFYNYITEPVKFIISGFLDFLPDLFFIIIIYLAARYLVKVLTYIGEEYEKDNIRIRGFHKDWAKPTLNIVKIIIYAFALIFMFPHLPGSDSPAFQGLSIFFGILLSLGSTSAISNIVAGLVITYMRPFQIGDRVRVDGTIGDVVEKSLLVTKIKTLKNEHVTIPNVAVINTHLLNFTKYTKNLGLILHTSVTIGYDVAMEKVHEILLAAAKQSKLIKEEPQPFVLQKSLDDFYVNYELNVYTDDSHKMPQIYSELHSNILKGFNEAGIEILSPHYNAMRDGNDIAIPEDYRNPVVKAIDKISGKPDSPQS
ncbi:MAG: mechanosensitive ion channel family protein [Bacteroidota bacterium]